MPDKLYLPVTLLCVDCVDADRAIKAVERCKQLCDFEQIKFLTSIPVDYPHKVDIFPITSHVQYSIWMLKECYKYIDTTHFLSVQHDGWILNPQSWNPEWLNYDHIGAIFNQADVMGAGGFSLRSKNLMEYMSKQYPEFDLTEKRAEKMQKDLHCYEDGEIAMRRRDELEGEGFKFPSLEEGAKFCQGGNPDVKYYFPYPFGFHGPYRQVDIQTGFVHKEVKTDQGIPQL